MCGIAGIVDLSRSKRPSIPAHLEVMNRLLEHRGPDGEGTWVHDRGSVGFAHRRLSIIDLDHGQQPMGDELGNQVTFNGEIYNYLELREELGRETFRTHSDTEVLLRAYREWGPSCVDHLRGMFAFAIWDESRQRLFCARDRFGIKPFYWAVADGSFYFASEAKAILPFLDAIETDVDAFKDYLCFQFCLDGKTLFKGVRELLPGHALEVHDGRVDVRRYWEVYYYIDFDHTPQWFERRLEALFEDSVRFHLRSDVPVGSYVSGGLDSSIVAALAAQQQDSDFVAFTGRFADGPAFDESQYARDLGGMYGFDLHEVTVKPQDFLDNIGKILYHLDYPVAGPGSFPQFMVSELAARHRKVVLGGQGGDEIFGGYTRYLVAYFEQCIKAAIDGKLGNGHFVVTYESIIPNLSALRSYKPMLQEFWRDGLFDSMDQRYFRLINRSRALTDEVNWDLLEDYSPFDTFQAIFEGDNVGKASYLEKMTHFDFKTLLPALLQVEDRMSMAHGLESRVPFLDHPLVEFAATIPSDVKFKDGRMKHHLQAVMGHVLPQSIRDRKDKMGFPVPLSDWIREDRSVREFVTDTFSSRAAANRDLIDNRRIVAELDAEPQFGRKIWGFLCLELWQRAFHDRAAEFKNLGKAAADHKPAEIRAIS